MQQFFTRIMTDIPALGRCRKNLKPGHPKREGHPASGANCLAAGREGRVWKANSEPDRNITESLTSIPE